MDLTYRLLTQQELGEGLKTLSGWSVEGEFLTKTFSFDAYQKGLVFASAVGFLADHLDHHPDLVVTYQKVQVKVNTHAVKGLSPYDLELAKRIEAFGGKGG